MKLVKKAKRGFTLVELVVVIAVIAILAAVSVGAYFGVTESANNSRLEQETKQLHTAIQQVSLGTKQNQSLGNDGLTVSNLIAFESDLKAATGQELKVTNDDVTNVYVPTIRLSTDEYRKPQNSGSKYLTFEYYNPEISGKKAVANVITGDCHIAESTATNNPNSNIKTFFYIDREWWRGDNLTTKVYACNEDGTKTNGSWPGVEPTLVEQLTYEEETIRVYSYDVDLDVYTKMAWTSSATNATNHTYKTNDILFSSMGENNLVINNLDEATNQFTPIFDTYVPGKVNYGQFPEANNVTYYFLDQEWWHTNEHNTKVYFFNKSTLNSPAWVTSFKDTTLVETIATEGHGSVNVYSITLDLNKWDSFIVVRTTAEGTVKSQTEDIALASFDEGENLAVLLDQEEVIKTDNNEAKCLVTTDTYVAGKWDYGQYPVIQEDIRTIYLKTAAWFDEAGAYPYICTYTGSTESDQLPMTLILDDVLGGISYWSAEVDLATHDGVYFKRMGTEGEQTNYWGATSVNFTRVQLEENNFATIANEAKWTNDGANFDITLGTYNETPTCGNYSIHLKGYKSWDSIDENKLIKSENTYTISDVELTETTIFKLYNDDTSCWMGATYFTLPENFIDDGSDNHNIKTTVPGIYTISVTETGIFTAEKTGDITVEDPTDPNPEVKELDVNFVGLEGDWSTLTKLTTDSDGTTAYGEVTLKQKDTFKIKDSDASWSGLNLGDSALLDSARIYFDGDGGNIKCLVAGTYVIEVTNANDKNLARVGVRSFNITTEPTDSDKALIGNYGDVDWKPEKQTLMKTYAGSNVIFITVDLEAGNQFKIKNKNNWDNAYNAAWDGILKGESSTYFKNAGGNDNNFEVKEGMSGKYTLCLNQNYHGLWVVSFEAK